MAEQLTPTELNLDCMEQARTDQIMDTQIKHTRKKGYHYIELSKQANSFTKANGSPGTKFSRSFLISWRNSTQWGPLLPKEGGLIQVDIGGHPPFPTGSK
jgi:lipoprotein-anchoring transpeptidase ErfK/SrfK